ncbi:hypothetical protein LCGC14_0787680 [marine sediment metagenome]|uniref:Uncharacterized protein n=1 Tax=marine sediment metagenome TaxID=412755 RepID=A0A0F9PXR1_9ZZZZ
MKRTVDRTKKSNIKCEHCTHWHKERFVCQRTTGVNLSRNYWNKCEFFEWS